MNNKNYKIEFHMKNKDIFTMYLGETSKDKIIEIFQKGVTLIANEDFSQVVNLNEVNYFEIKESGI